MDDHKGHDHDEREMANISGMTSQLVDQLCAMYGQCAYHTMLTIFKDAVEGIEYTCQTAENEGSAAEKTSAARMRKETAEVLSGLASIIKGDTNVTATKH